jgi:hypothetical protein
MSVNDSDLEGGPIATEIGESAPGMSAPAKNIPAKRTLQQIAQKNALLPKNIKRPKVIIPHAEPPPPAGYDVVQVKKQTSAEIAQHFLSEGFLEQHVGDGVYQGPNYAETALYRFEAHEECDGFKPLLPEFLVQQQFMMRQENTKLEFDRLPQVKSSDPKKHKENTKLDFNISELSNETRSSLIEDRVEIEGDFTHTYKYDYLPKTSVFKNGTRKTRSEGLRSVTQERGLEDSEESKE